jgi:hypothetical protein
MGNGLMARTDLRPGRSPRSKFQPVAGTEYNGYADRYFSSLLDDAKTGG